MKRCLVHFSLLLLPVGSAFSDPLKDESRNRPHRDRGSDFTARFFERLDTDKDGFVNQAEFAVNPRLKLATEEQREKLFRRLDKNGDGLIKRKELKPPKGKDRGRPEWLKNGPVNFATFSQLPRIQRLDEEQQRRLFNRLDRNSDGILDKKDAPKHLKENRAGSPKMFEKMDTDNNGTISFLEFQQASFHRQLSEDEVEDRFENLDTDGNALLSPEEHAKEPKKKIRKPR